MKIQINVRIDGEDYGMLMFFDIAEAVTTLQNFLEEKQARLQQSIQKES
jgi:hypothetical protein